MDKKLTDLFQQWLVAIEAMQAARNEAEATAAHETIMAIESTMAATPAEGLNGLAVKLGLHCFLNDHADAASEQSESAYRDLVRLTGFNPAVEIAARFDKKAA